MQFEVRDYNDIGSYLRDVRESHRLDVRDIAQHLNIRAKYLVALENGTLGDIPGKVYARGYLQNYAEYLGLDKNEIAEAFDRVQATQKQVKYFVPEPTARSYQPGMLMVGSAIGVVFLIYLYWYSTHKEVLNPPAHEMVSPVPERLLNPLAAESQLPEGQFGPPIPAELVPAPGTETTLSPDATAPATATPEAATTPAAKTPAAAPTTTAPTALPWQKKQGQ